MCLRRSAGRADPRIEKSLIDAEPLMRDHAHIDF